jgi:tetratricopeptide (TPR) repeat protein
MGSKSRFIILIFLILQISSYAQKAGDYAYVDSITYSYYNSGKWDSLIQLGNQALGNNIDYKYLRQRIGYAYFIQGNYFDAKINFEKALTFDSFDQFTLEYLYYAYLNTGKNDYTGTIVKKSGPLLKKSLSVKPFIIVESIDLEYNYKYAGTKNRSNPQFYRIGIATKLGYSLNLYQSISNYNQEITSVMNGKTITTSYRQPEYYALLKWNISNKLLINTGYHFFNTTSGTLITPGSLFLLSISANIDRFILEGGGSVLYSKNTFVYQAGGTAGFVLPGKSDLTFKSSVAGVYHQTGSQLVYNQMAGLKLSKKVWFEANATIGRMTDYNDYTGLYIYNTYDPIDFRSGGTIIFYAGKKISIWANYTFERKEYFENNSFHYNQFSYLGGIRWKL